MKQRKPRRPDRRMIPLRLTAREEYALRQLAQAERRSMNAQVAALIMAAYSRAAE